MNKRIIITGASGLLGGLLAEKLKDRVDLVLISGEPDRLRTRFSASKIFKRDCLEEIGFKPGDIVIHAGFARTYEFEQLGKSLEFTKQILTLAGRNHVSGFINISSRSVYGQQPLPWLTNTNTEPDSPYALAKTATEQLTFLVDSLVPETAVSNIRLAGLIHETLEARILNKLVKRALTEHTLSITGGTQQFAFLYADDAAAGIIALTEKDPASWKSIYNLGSVEKYTIIELAEHVAKQVEQKTGLPVKIDFTPSDAQLIDGMDCQDFYSDCHWEPKYRIDDMIVTLINYNRKEVLQ